MENSDYAEGSREKPIKSQMFKLKKAQILYHASVSSTEMNARASKVYIIFY